jgi:hypothetical protein
MKREEKGWRELMEKAAGDERLYNLVEDRAGAIPNAAGGEDGHGAATPDVATHTYSDSQVDPRLNPAKGAGNHDSTMSPHVEFYKTASLDKAYKGYTHASWRTLSSKNRRIVSY